MTALPDPDVQAEFYEGVALKRLIAFLIDGVLIFALAALAVPFTAFLGLFMWPALYLMVGFVYRVATLSNGSATLGMRFCGIELREYDGARLDGGSALLHTVGFTVSMAVPVLQVISILLMLTTARGQGLTDHMLGTVMLKRRA
ncbi:RDD family protein [Tritonibacter horizontis]|uniref:RDD family protein n=1 Tax=Tritonibacter horizontis TaxID=1768241 RepID=A0A132BX26_9RHOB|nr:RDD family protein [Tritonibacter horizontis]KUP92290.1 RDD family protein [Tritonibacter horizontis]